MSIQQDSTELIITQLEASRQAPLSQDEKDAISLWQKGRALEQVTRIYGWECVLEMLQSYVVEANRDLVATSPDKKDEVAAKHAIVFALSKLYDNFIQDVQNAISAEAPECVIELVQSQSPALNS